MKRMASNQRSKPSTTEEEGFDKQEWVRGLKALKKEALLEERERFRPITALKRDMREFVEEFEKEDKKNEIQLKKEMAQHLEFVEKQKLDIDCARSMINQSRIDPSFLDKIHGKVKYIEQNFKNFKLKSRGIFESLVEQEQSLSAELSLLQEKFDTFQFEKAEHHSILAAGQPSRKPQRPSSMSRLTKPKQQASSQRNRDLEASDAENEEAVDKQQAIKEEIDRLDRELVANGGKNCGWDDADHKDFLRVRTKFNNKTGTIAFLTELISVVPNQDEETIHEHVVRYEKYLDLCDQKKKLVLEFKEVKKKQQQERVSRVDDQNLLFKRINSDLESVGLGKENKSFNTAEERLKMKEELEKWKKEKDEKQRRELEDKKRQEDLMKRKLRQQLEEEKRMKKEQVEDFKFRKEMEKQREKQLIDLEKRKQKQQMLSQEQRERIIKREEEVFTKKHQRILDRQLQQEEREARLEEMKQKASRGIKEKVESKLNQETQAQRDKKRQKFDEKNEKGKDAMTMGGNLLGVSVRAMPMWRGGI